MANKAKKTESPAKKVVKVSGVKVRTREEARPFLSKRDTQPLNDVIDNQGKLVEGLTESEKIAQGYLAPLVRTPSFRKNKYARSKWREVHTNEKGPTGGTLRKNFREFKHTLVVHFTNESKLGTFKTTRSFPDVRFSEIQTVLRSALNMKFDEEPYLSVKNFFHGGKKYGISVTVDKDGNKKARPTQEG